MGSSSSVAEVAVAAQVEEAQPVSQARTDALDELAPPLLLLPPTLVLAPQERMVELG